jgi:beta-mannosidase
MSTFDLLAGAAWECCGVSAGAATSPAELGRLQMSWLPATVPGTAAGALVAAGIDPERHDLDGEDWWFRCRFAGGPGRFRLHIGGIATIADVFLNDAPIHHGENMFRAYLLEGLELADDNELTIRCAALAPRLARRRPRPRWKTYLVESQNIRFMRTSLLGRLPGWAVTPPPVGPWRGATLAPESEITVVGSQLVATCTGEGGLVEATVRLRGDVEDRAGGATLICGGRRAPAVVSSESGEIVVSGEVRLDRVERWWPHTHGRQPLYDIELELGAGQRLAIGRTGFRTLEVDRREGRFALIANGEEIFARGACWLPLDPVSMAASPAAVAGALGQARDAGMNMVRVLGTGAYETPEFFAACDDLGLMVWHDCMLAFTDPPDDEDFTRELEAELGELFAAWSGHPSLAVVCGSQEVEEVAVMNGLARAGLELTVLDKTIPRLVETSLPGVAYETSCPTGGGMPFRMDSGTSQYFGVGGYLRPPSDARRAGVRFAAECLALSTPPERQVVESSCGGAQRAGHDPEWKKGVHHDAGRSWDMEDVRDFYVRSLFGTDPLLARYTDPERALDLGRAANAELMSQVFAEWRTPSSLCAGGLVLALRDLRPGAGWGVVDSFGIPKAPWYTLARTFAPIALLLTDEGLNGLRVHVLNDTAAAFSGRVELRLFADGERLVDSCSVSVDAPARGSAVLDAGEAFAGFRDISYAFRFGPPQHDLVVADLIPDLVPDLVADLVADGGSGEALATAFHLPLGQARPLEDDVGLQVAVRRSSGGLSGPGDPGAGVLIEIGTRRFAQWVSIEVPGFVPADSWFHLAPGAQRLVRLRPFEPYAAGAEPFARQTGSGLVRALNSRRVVRFGLAESGGNDG